MQSSTIIDIVRKQAKSCATHIYRHIDELHEKIWNIWTHITCWCYILYLLVLLLLPFFILFLSFSRFCCMSYWHFELCKNYAWLWIFNCTFINRFVRTCLTWQVRKFNILFTFEIFAAWILTGTGYSCRE